MYIYGTYFNATWYKLRDIKHVALKVAGTNWKVTASRQDTLQAITDFLNGGDEGDQLLADDGSRELPAGFDNMWITTVDTNFMDYITRLSQALASIKDSEAKDVAAATGQAKSDQKSVMNEQGSQDAQRTLIDLAPRLMRLTSTRNVAVHKGNFCARAHVNWA
jgi:hypothetical protein